LFCGAEEVGAVTQSAACVLLVDTVVPKPETRSVEASAIERIGLGICPDMVTFPHSQTENVLAKFDRNALQIRQSCVSLRTDCDTIAYEPDNKNGTNPKIQKGICGFARDQHLHLQSIQAGFFCRRALSAWRPGGAKTPRDFSCGPLDESLLDRCFLLSLFGAICLNRSTSAPTLQPDLRLP
jgi:hypothetical protein